MSEKEKIYIVDQNPIRSEKIQTILEFMGKICSIIKITEIHLQNKIPSLLLYGTSDPLEIVQIQLQLINNCFQNTPIILIGNKYSVQQFAKYNIVDSLNFPFKYPQLLNALHQGSVKKKIFSFSNGVADSLEISRLVGDSNSTSQIKELIRLVANTDASVMILGETGTGKELVAKNIHDLSDRSNKPFIAINCGAIPADLFESELFGHEKGAFTGAVSSRQGRFELANDGTLFLDEIGDMPLFMQVKLLRVLQERAFERVGSNKRIEINVRIICATHKNLEESMSEGLFRKDLYYRLNLFPIHTTPLRERIEDIPAIISQILSQLALKNRPVIHLLPEAERCLLNYSWPGNVRELSNIIERLTILFPAQIIGKKDLPELIQNAPLNLKEANIDRVTDIITKKRFISSHRDLGMKVYLENIEMDLIQEALQKTNWIVARAAEQLKIRRTTLIEKMKKYKLIRPIVIEQ